MRKSFIILAATFLSLSAAAQTIERIQTRDGSVYNGFISEQQPGNHIHVYAENGTIFFKKSDMLNLRKDYYDFQLLSEESKQMLRHHCDTTSLLLSSFEYKGRYYENLFVTEYLDSTVRALAVTPRTYILPWSDLVKTTRLAYTSVPYGIRDIITLKSGERIVGQIVEQVVSKSIVLRDDKGFDHNLNSADVLSVMSEKISEKNPLWMQTPLLDRLVFANGSVLEGFITSRLMGQHINLLMKYSNEPQQVSVKDIVKYQKTRNHEYKPYVPDTAKVITLNDKPVELLALTEEDGLYHYKDTLVQTFFTDDELHLAFKNIDCAKTAALYEYVDVSDTSSTRAKSKKKIDKCEAIAVNANPLYETPYIEDDGYFKCTVIVRKPGKYFLTIDGFKSGLNLEFIYIK